VESSDILVVVADNGESIEKPSQAAERLPRLRYHCTPKGVSPETGRWTLAQQAVQRRAMQGVEGRTAVGERGPQNTPLDKCRYNEYCRFAVCPLYNFTKYLPSFPPGLGGSWFDLLHFDRRAIDPFDDVLNRGASDEPLGVFVPSLHKCLDRLL